MSVGLTQKIPSTISGKRRKMSKTFNEVEGKPIFGRLSNLSWQIMRGQVSSLCQEPFVQVWHLVCRWTDR